MLINKTQAEAIAEAIKQAERGTDAELVAVLARQADDYRYIPTLWAALAALLTPAVLSLTGWWFDTMELILLQLFAFVTLTLVFRWRRILFYLIPKSVRSWRASSLARRQFLENNLHHTVGDSGVLIFISEAEHYVEIIADRGIDAAVDDEQWQVIVNGLIDAIKRNEAAEGIEAAVKACGELLAIHVPATREKNELSNHLVII